jgi:hypothetical protein
MSNLSIDPKLVEIASRSYWNNQFYGPENAWRRVPPSVKKGVSENMQAAIQAVFDELVLREEFDGKITYAYGGNQQRRGRVRYISDWRRAEEDDIKS